MASLSPVFVYFVKVQQKAQLVLTQLQTVQRATETLATAKGRNPLWSCVTSGHGSGHHAPGTSCITPGYWEASWCTQYFWEKPAGLRLLLALLLLAGLRNVSQWYHLPDPFWRWQLRSNVNSRPPKAASHLSTLAIASVPRAQAHGELFSMVSETPLPAGEMFWFPPETISTLKQELWFCPSS